VSPLLGRLSESPRGEPHPLVVKFIDQANRLVEISALCDSVIDSPWSDDPYVNAGFLAEDIKSIVTRRP
jgi:hypothetical protein